MLGWRVADCKSRDLALIMIVTCIWTLRLRLDPILVASSLEWEGIVIDDCSIGLRQGFN